MQDKGKCILTLSSYFALILIPNTLLYTYTRSYLISPESSIHRSIPSTSKNRNAGKNRPDLTHFDGIRLICGSDLNYKYSLEAFVVAYNFGDKTVAWAEMQDQVPAHCVSLSHGEQQ